MASTLFDVSICRGIQLFTEGELTLYESTSRHGVQMFTWYYDGPMAPPVIVPSGGVG